MTNPSVGTPMMSQRSKKFANVKSRLGLMPVSRGSDVYKGFGSNRSGSGERSQKGTGTVNLQALIDREIIIDQLIDHFNKSQSLTDVSDQLF
jgi:hypothetical protein